MASNDRGSILSADFGSVTTRVVLIDSVDGVYRLIARGTTRTTDGYPVYDIAVGFDRALRSLAEATGRRFMSDGGEVIIPEQPDRSGTDLLALTASLGRPLRAVIVGLVPDMSIASALRAAAGTYIDVAATISLDDGRDEEGRLNAVLLTSPDLVFIAGGTEKGSKGPVMRMVEVVKMAVALIDPSHRPIVIFSGNSQLTEPVTEAFDGVTRLLIAGNVRPSHREERLDSARLQLGISFDQYQENHNESLAIIGENSHTGVLPTAQGYRTVAEYFGSVRTDGIALVDVGSSVSTLAVSLNNEIISSIRTDIGLGHSATALLEAAGVEAVQKWLPLNASKSDLQNYALNKSLRPATIPVTLWDLHIEHALLKSGYPDHVGRCQLGMGRRVFAPAIDYWGGRSLDQHRAPGL